MGNKGNKLMEYLKEFIVDTYYNGGIYSAYLRKFVFCLDFYLNVGARKKKI